MYLKIYIDKILGETDITQMVMHIIPEFAPSHKKNSQQLSKNEIPLREKNHPPLTTTPCNSEIKID